MLTINHTNESLLTVSAVARRLNCHPSSVTRWIQKGTATQAGNVIKLEAIRLPGGWRIEREALSDFLTRLKEDREPRAALVPAVNPRRDQARHRAAEREAERLGL